ncbi:MAG TPA: ATP-binding protein [Solirubrobacteraceae bacterium]|jgi:signal transduction histidine kinase|nr:ATP-binding protein [Solirubrobacteraceae bacterium]
MTAPDTLQTTVGDLRSPRRLLARYRPRFPRYTIRLRLAVLYSGVFLILGTLLLAIIFLSVRHSTHGTVVSAQGAVAKLVEHRHLGIAPPGSTLTVVPESLAGQEQAHKLGAVAVDVNSSDLHQLLVWSVFALAIMAIASVALGWVLAGRVLRPLQVITATARELSATNLHERLALSGPNDELRELGDTFDELLGRLESSFEAQRQFVANASHELRTPLTLERAILEVTLADPDASATSLRTACERVLSIGEQQEHMIDALLTLARSERGLERQEPLLLDTLAGKVLEERGEEAARRGLRLDNKLERAPTAGDRQLIERLIANLLDNAIHHNSPHGWVTVATALDAGAAVLTVSNSGPLIEPEELASLMRPFQRLGIDRTGHGDGHGLGLSIVEAIATAHGAILTVQPHAAGGLQAEVRFPNADASQPGPQRSQ